jgi:peptide/nickel transport system permease protein
MVRYIVKRILLFALTLVAVSLITFVISSNAPGDPIGDMLTRNQGGEGTQSSQRAATEKAYNALRHELGFDLPVFYFTISNATYCDTLYKVSKSNHRTTLERLSYAFGNWGDVSNYYKAIRNFESDLFNFKKDTNNAVAINSLRNYTAQLYDNYTQAKIESIFVDIDNTINGTRGLKSLFGQYSAMKNGYEACVHNQSTWKRFIPVIYWYGTNSQYHRWMFGTAPWFGGAKQPDDNYGFLRGDFGISYQDKRPVGSIVYEALPNTMWLSLTSIFLAYLLAIPIGVRAAVRKGSVKERSTTAFLFILYSLPNFWIATMLVIYFCGGDYLSWFPAPGSPPIPDDAPLWYSITQGFYRSILPLVCWTYASLAFTSRQMRGGMLAVIGQDYIRTARAKGLDEKAVIWKHAFKNSLLPIITLFANIFPAAIAGSFVIEFIFQIPGMGKVTLEALNSHNYPIIFTTMMFTAMLTMVGTLIADVLYAVVDPRISFTGKKG